MTSRDKYLKKIAKEVKEGHCELPNGCQLSWKADLDVPGRRYFSNEIGLGVEVWNTAMVDDSTLLAALTNEVRLKLGERHLDEEKEKKAKYIGKRMAELVNDVVTKVAKKKGKE